MDSAQVLSRPPATSHGRRMLNKVPEITVYFWVIKVLCTTVGETFADNLNENLGLGLTNTSYIMGAVLIAVIVAQFRSRRYIPGIYWLACGVSESDRGQKGGAFGSRRALQPGREEMRLLPELIAGE